MHGQDVRRTSGGSPGSETHLPAGRAPTAWKDAASSAHLRHHEASLARFARLSCLPCEYASHQRESDSARNASTVTRNAGITAIICKKEHNSMLLLCPFDIPSPGPTNLNRPSVGCVKPSSAATHHHISTSEYVPAISRFSLHLLTSSSHTSGACPAGGVHQNPRLPPPPVTELRDRPVTGHAGIAACLRPVSR
jgi:hypothetical protein